MKSRILFLFILLSILITSCNTSNKVVSSSFIQKRKYTKGYHFDLASKRANSHQPLAISQKHPDLIGMAKQIIPVHKKEIPSWEENRKAPVILDSVLGDNRDLSASVDNGNIIIHPQKNVLDEDNFIGQKETADEQHSELPKVSVFAILSFIFAYVGLSFAFLMGLMLLGLYFSVPLFIVDMILGIGGFIFGVIAIIQISDNPEKYSKLGFAIVGVIVSIVSIILAVSIAHYINKI